MANISIYIPDEDVDKIYDAYAVTFGRPDLITDPDGNTSPNPESKSDFTNSMLRKYIQNIYNNYVTEKARRVYLEAVSNPYTLPTADTVSDLLYRYIMIAPVASITEFNGIAGILMPGTSFNIPLKATDGTEQTHAALIGECTESVRQQLAAFEFLGALGASPISSVQYVRINRATGLSIYSNIEGFETGKASTLEDVASFLNLDIM